MTGGEGLVAGVDCSTQSTTVLVVDPAGRHGRRTRRRAARGHRRGRRAAARTRSAGGRRCATRSRRPAAPGAWARSPWPGSSTGSSCWTTRGARPGPAALWNDTTSAPDAAALLEDLGGREAWAAAVGSVPTASFTVTKWARLRREEPERAARAAAVRLPHDFLTERLCGEAVTDRGDASGSGWWSPAAGAYAEQVLGLARVALDPALLPRVLRGGEPAGGVRAAAAAELGLPEGAVVAAGHRGQHGRGDRARPGAGRAGREPRHLGHRVRRDRAPGGRPDAASSPASPTRGRASCRSCAR